jgi:peroxiredoxin Q/BCP
MENKVLTDVDLSKLVGTKGLVVFFYPKAGTTGCSLEAQQYNRRLKEFQDLGYNVVGVSVDSTDANKTFSNDCKLDFPLISDTEKKLVDQYKV